jgi:GrpB-like predicted nucleotidyltransferase (UPF0157 family)
VLRLVEYDDRWPGLFVAECERISEQSGALPLKLEHVGGTSIPGMCSKPILDIAAGRPLGIPIGSYVSALERAGYEHRGEHGVPGRQFFCRGDPRSYHLHLVVEGGSLWSGYLTLRDYLRTHADAAREFSEVKRALAARFPGDREAYMNAKSVHVQELLKRAIAPD